MRADIPMDFCYFSINRFLQNVMSPRLNVIVSTVFSLPVSSGAYTCGDSAVLYTYYVRLKELLKIFQLFLFQF